MIRVYFRGRMSPECLIGKPSGPGESRRQEPQTVSTASA